MLVWQLPPNIIRGLARYPKETVSICFWCALWFSTPFAFAIKFGIRNSFGQFGKNIRNLVFTSRITTQFSCSTCFICENKMYNAYWIHWIQVYWIDWTTALLAKTKLGLDYVTIWLSCTTSNSNWSSNSFESEITGVVCVVSINFFFGHRWDYV